MDTPVELTSPCGLFCQDCIPADTGFFKLLEELKEVLKKLEFHRYAALKSKTVPALADYPVFEKVLSGMAGLACQAPCRRGGGKSDCRVRLCVGEKGYQGCWECSGHGTCDLLGPLKEFHHLDRNLRMIRELGIKDWLPKRARHYRWLE